MRESSKRVAPWRQAVMWTTENEYHHPLIIDPVYVEITFFFTRPKGHYGTGKNCTKLKNSAPSHCTSSLHGDIDKLARCTLDGLARRSGGCVLKDDSLVVMLKCSKRYAEANETPGALVRITPIR
jgi:crossover junction endodeoxyribonuclease RusA